MKMDYLFVESKSIDFKVKVNSCSPTNRFLFGKNVCLCVEWTLKEFLFVGKNLTILQKSLKSS